MYSSRNRSPLAMSSRCSRSNLINASSVPSGSLQLTFPPRRLTCPPALSTRSMTSSAVISRTPATRRRHHFGSLFSSHVRNVLHLFHLSHPLQRLLCFQ